MTTYRQKELEPIRARILEALEISFSALKVSDGYYYDWNKASLADEKFLDEFQAAAWGNAILIFDGVETLEANLRTDLEEKKLELEIVAILKDSKGERRYKVVARIIADIDKAFRAFRDSQAALTDQLIGPARITRCDPFDYDNGLYAVACSADLIYQHDDGDATAIS